MSATRWQLCRRFFALGFALGLSQAAIAGPTRLDRSPASPPVASAGTVSVSSDLPNASKVHLLLAEGSAPAGVFFPAPDAGQAGVATAGDEAMFDIAQLAGATLLRSSGRSSFAPERPFSLGDATAMSVPLPAYGVFGLAAIGAGMGYLGARWLKLKR